MILPTDLQWTKAEQMLSAEKIEWAEKTTLKKNNECVCLWLEIVN